MESQLSPEQREALIAQLKEPFHPREVHWRVLRKQKNNDKRGEVVAYVKSSAYRERLTSLFTISGWTSHCEILMTGDISRQKGNVNLTTGKVMVACTVTIHGLGTHSSTGEAWADDDNGLTTAEAQAFKRTCAIFGLGEYISKLEKPWVDLDQYGNIVDKNGQKFFPALPNWALPAKYLEECGPQMSRQEARQQQQGAQQAQQAPAPATAQQRQQAPAAAQQQRQQAPATAQQRQGEPATAATPAPAQSSTQTKANPAPAAQQSHTKEELERLFGAAKSQIGTALFTSITTLVREGYEQGKYTGDKNTTALEFMNRAVQSIQKIREMAAEVGESVFVANMDNLKISSLTEMNTVADLTSLKLAMEQSVKTQKAKAA
ncbi:MAG: Rad52/Rad22 family DNA repair protein [Terriglobia bacterium]|nr:Rad52/Rad22 family DNA repair protein [Terriglobia bacterium]